MHDSHAHCQDTSMSRCPRNQKSCHQLQSSKHATYRGRDPLRQTRLQHGTPDWSRNPSIYGLDSQPSLGSPRGNQGVDVTWVGSWRRATCNSRACTTNKMHEHTCALSKGVISDYAHKTLMTTLVEKIIDWWLFSRGGVYRLQVNLAVCISPTTYWTDISWSRSTLRQFNPL